METIEVRILLAGLALVVLGYLALLAVAFRQHWGWGLALLIPPGLPLASLAFIGLRWQRARGPFCLLLLGAVTAGSAYGLNRYYQLHPDQGARLRLVKDEAGVEQLHITLTGWDREDYSFLRYQTDVVVLQMANKDVTDQTLEFLRGMPRLRQLDLSNSQVTDAGLVVLETLPRLDTLWLTNTGVTDQGVRDHLLALKTLKKLDLRQTAVKGATARAWKEAQEGRTILR